MNTYSEVLHFKITPEVNEANNTLLVNHARSDNNTFPKFNFHNMLPVGKSHTIISPAPAKNK